MDTILVKNNHSSKIYNWKFWTTLFWRL